MSRLTLRQIEQLDQARARGLSETQEMPDPVERTKYIRRNYFPFGRPQDNWPAYEYWKDLFKDIQTEVLLLGGSHDQK